MLDSLPQDSTRSVPQCDVSKECEGLQKFKLQHANLEGVKDRKK